METNYQPPILVAVDASPESLAALDWAITHALSLDRRLRIITAFGPPNAPSSDTARSYVDEIEHAELLAEERVRASVQTVVDRDNLRYDHIVEIGPIDRVLRQYSHHASLAVIGTRTPRNRFQRLFQKSVTNKLTGSLACPVVSVTLAGSTDNLTTPGHLAVQA